MRIYLFDSITKTKALSWPENEILDILPFLRIPTLMFPPILHVTAKSPLLSWSLHILNKY
jgi:hypothetical protein